MKRIQKTFGIVSMMLALFLTVGLPAFAGTPTVAPRADGEGSLGASGQTWGALWVETINMTNGFIVLGGDQQVQIGDSTNALKNVYIDEGRAVVGNGPADEFAIDYGMAVGATGIVFYTAAFDVGTQPSVQFTPYNSNQTNRPTILSVSNKFWWTGAKAAGTNMFTAVATRP